MTRRVVGWALKSTAVAQLRAVNWHYLHETLPSQTVHRGRHAPEPVTLRYQTLCQWADGTWGFEVDDYIRGLHGQTIGNSPRHVIDVSGERDMPLRTVEFGGAQVQTQAAAVTEPTGGDA